MNNSKRILALLLVVAAVLAMLSCSAQRSLVGTWECSTDVLGKEINTTYTFNKDGTGSFGTVLGISTDFTYSVTDDVVEISYELLGIKKTEQHDFVVKGDKLFLTLDEIAMEFSKKK